MKMVIGGAYQGKLQYAQTHYSPASYLRGEDALEAEIYQAAGVVNLHLFIRNHLADLFKDEESCLAFADRLYKENPQIILVTDEVGYGVVPMDPFDRSYREAVGRTCTRLASLSEEVIRVFCGIGTKIK